MSKFVYTTDWHIRSNPSENIGIENYQNSLLGRIEMILDTDCDFIVHGGDMFQSPRIDDDLSLFNAVVKLLYDYKKLIYVIPGNHDLIGYASESLSQSCLQTLHNAGLVYIIPPGLSTIHGVPLVAVYPTTSHTVDLYKGLSKSVVITHNLLSPKPVRFKHVLISDVAAVVDHCLFLCGDLHARFEEFFETSAFLNPGQLMCNSLSESDEGSGFFVIDFDAKDFSVQYKKVLFPPLVIEKIRSAKEKDIHAYANLLRFDSGMPDLVKLVETVGNELYKDPILTAEALQWINSKK